jgi:hypothetical protein
LVATSLTQSLSMAYDIGSGYAPRSTSNMQEDDAAPMFNIERVALQFNISSDFVAAAVGNNVFSGAFDGAHPAHRSGQPGGH